MGFQKLVRSREAANSIWNRRELYRLDNFSTYDICRIYKELHPQSALYSRMNHYKSFVSRFSDCSISTLSTSELNQWLQEVKQTTDLSERTLNQIKCQLNPFFKWLLEEKIIDANPLTGIKFKRKVPPKRKRVVFSEVEMKILSDAAKNFEPVTLYPYLFALLQTGARRSEISKLQWDDVDLDNGFIIFRNTKNGSDRKIQMSDSLKRLIQGRNKSSKFVFPNKNQLFFNRSAIERAVNSFKSSFDCGKDWHLHDLRHSFAYNFLRKGGEMYQLQSILGHRSIQMTVDLYGNLKAYDVKNPSPYDF